MADRPRLPRAAKKPVDFSGGGARLPKRKSPDDVPPPPARPAKKPKRNNATGGSAAEEQGWTDDVAIKGLLWTDFPYVITANPYFDINHSDAKGKTIESKVAFIPAGKLLWEEESLFQDFPHWRKGANKRESKQEFEDRIQAVLWSKWGKSKKTVFANFSTLSEEGAAGEHHFFGDSKAARIDANAGGEIGNKDMMVAYKLLNFVSHSCRPNCRITDRGHDSKPRWQLRTLVPITGIGTELTINYDDCPQTPDVVIDDEKNLLETVAERQETNDESYQFQCTCEACEDSEATDSVREDIRDLHDKLMADLPAEVTVAKWRRLATDCDVDMERYIELCKTQHLFPMALQAHERAVLVYTNSNRVRKKPGGAEISRSDRVRVKEHSFGQAEMRRLLYGLWDPDLEEPLNKIVEPLREAREEEAREQEEAREEEEAPRARRRRR